jgi:cyclic beta-1,2-glucan synthetase
MAADPAIRLGQAAERGTFNVGDAKASISVSADPVAGEVLKLDYTIPTGTAAGVWAKKFPDGLNAANIDVIRPAVRSVDPKHLRQVAVTLEVKGTSGTQRIPVELHPDWTTAECLVAWTAIGTVTEVVVSVARVGEGPPVVGSIALDVRFEQLPLLRRLGMIQVARIVGVLVVGLIAAMLMHFALPILPRRLTPDVAPSPGLRRDFVLGAGTAAIGGLTLVIYALGGMGPIEVGWLPLAVAVAGLVVSWFLQFGLTGKPLSAAETFQDVLATGLLAAAVSPLAILQSPTGWPQLLMLSAPVAAVAAILYHAANAIRMASTGKHLGAVAGGLIVGTPFAVGGLLLLESGGLVHTLGGLLTVGSLSSRPMMVDFIGRVAVLFAFNELATFALGLATKRGALRSIWTHLSLLAVAVAAIAGPWIASFGSGNVVASWHTVARYLALVASGVLSQAGLWAEGYLLTGMVLDAIARSSPTRESIVAHPVTGMKKGMVYSGTFLGTLCVIGWLSAMPVVQKLAVEQPLILGCLFGALAFPLAKTIIETFDGSQAFFRRVRNSYRDPILYARGVMVGAGLAYGLSHGMPRDAMSNRVAFGFLVGLAAYALVNVTRDAIGSRAEIARVQPVRVYIVQGLLGGFIGAAIGFYLDATQVAVVVAKFHRYIDVGQAPKLFGDNVLLSRWGYLRLGDQTGGASLLFAESLYGVISWAIPSWLFAINRTFMSAYFNKESAPIKAMFTRSGLVQIVESMIGVLRWGLWMSPIINSFLRPMGEPTWYNQDGAIRTVVATAHDLTTSHSAFRAWSLDVFISLLAYDWVRILIWIDHMGLRVATLVNLSFLGMDRLDRRLSRFLAPAATARCIPEGVKRFTTWAPLLIPYYIPRGKDWDTGWSRAETIRAGEQGGIVASITALPTPWQLLLLAVAIAASTATFSAVRWLRDRSGSRRRPVWTLENAEYEVTAKENGEIFSRVKARGYDVSRRSYDLIDPAGRALFLVDSTGTQPTSWRLIGNVAGTDPCRIERAKDALRITADGHGVRSSIEIRLPSPGDPVELWTITLENQGDTTRRIQVIPYLEWVLNRPEADRGHTQYNRLFAEIEYVGGLHAVLAWDQHMKAMGLLASDIAPSGFLSSRMDFLGRARSLGDPRVLQTLRFTEPKDTEANPTFDPIGSLLLGTTLPARGSTRVRLLIGLVADKRRAIDLIASHLNIPGAQAVADSRRRKASHTIGHGEIPPGTPIPYDEFSEDGRGLIVHTPFTTRPFDHTLANALGHVVVVTNRGLHTTSSVNSQQNRVTPEWSDTVTREVPSEAFYLHDPSSGEWFSPAYHPVNDDSASHECIFGVDGTATFRMTKGTIETELTVFVPPDDPAGLYRLTIRNTSGPTRRLRVASYFQIVLAVQPEMAGPLEIRSEEELGALCFENPRNTFRSGPAFASMVGLTTIMETRRGRFFGDRGIARPHLVEHGSSATDTTGDDRPVAAFLGEIDIPSGAERTVVVVLGQADDRERAVAVLRKYRDPDASLVALEETRRWWTGLMGTVEVQTDRPEFDRYLEWLKYQALAERIWARRGFYQASGAYGFRDQLQDSVNLIWMDPAVARNQILLHASQQFLEGDVVHWFHLLQDGRTGFVGRTHASDNLLWLAWGVVDYVGATGDDSLLDERRPYLESDLPFEPLPAGKLGMGFDPLRSSRDDSVYRHCMRAIDLVLQKRMGIHGLPLMGTGDWNDGLDAIGSEGKGESVWLGFFLVYILNRMVGIIEKRDGPDRASAYRDRLRALKDALEQTWRGDRYLRAFHDDGSEIGVKGSGIWEIDALTAAWAVMSGINPERGRIVFETALEILEKEKTILLGWPSLREDSHPYLGRSSDYPEGVRENGMYCHGVQWLVGAARLMADEAASEGRSEDARSYRDTAHRLWWKISAIPHSVPGEVETYGGQPNQQAADMVTTFDQGRMIWNGYTGAAGWMFRQAIEGVLGMRLDRGKIISPTDPSPSGEIGLIRLSRDVSQSPLTASATLRPPAQSVEPERTNHPS